MRCLFITKLQYLFSRLRTGYIMSLHSSLKMRYDIVSIIGICYQLSGRDIVILLFNLWRKVPSVVIMLIVLLYSPTLSRKCFWLFAGILLSPLLLCGVLHFSDQSVPSKPLLSRDVTDCTTSCCLFVCSISFSISTSTLAHMLAAKCSSFLSFNSLEMGQQRYNSLVFATGPGSWNLTCAVSLPVSFKTVAKLRRLISLATTIQFAVIAKLRRLVSESTTI